VLEVSREAQDDCDEDKPSLNKARQMDLRELLRKVEAAPNGTTELDSKFASVFPSAPRNVTRSIDAAGAADRKRTSRLVVDLRALHTQ
jgi:ribosomal protein S20